MRRGKAKDVRRAVAQEQQAEAAERTPEEQLKCLDRRLGKDIGAVKERLKLNKRAKAQKEES
jgi:hypothetical protein|tara:strand:+ start:3587 stop:3772 length:186 start_codon:yes stop_codon:yes gene_type:complete